MSLAVSQGAQVPVLAGPTSGRPAGARVKVGIADEHEMFALGLKACMAGHPTLEWVAEIDGETDVAVVSTRMAGDRRFPCPLVVCGDVPSRLAAGNVMLAVLPRATLTAEQLVAGVQAAAAGLVVSSPVVVTPSKLDARALEVLSLLSTGAGTREIAEQLGYSDRTIKTIVSAIQAALGVRTRAQAVAEGIRQGLI